MKAAAAACSATTGSSSTSRRDNYFDLNVLAEEQRYLCSQDGGGGGQLNASLVQPPTTTTGRKSRCFGERSFFSGSREREVSAQVKEFSRLYKIKRSRFVEVLREFDADLQMFHQIQDEFMLFGSSHTILAVHPSLCLACSSSAHCHDACAALHFVADRVTLFQGITAVIMQERCSSYERQKFKGKNTLADTYNLSKEAATVCFRNAEFIKKILKNISDSNSEEWYDEDEEDCSSSCSSDQSDISKKGGGGAGSSPTNSLKKLVARQKKINRSSSVNAMIADGNKEEAVVAAESEASSFHPGSTQRTSFGGGMMVAQNNTNGNQATFLQRGKSRLLLKKQLSSNNNNSLSQHVIIESASCIEKPEEPPQDPNVSNFRAVGRKISGGDGFIGGVVQLGAGRYTQEQVKLLQHHQRHHLNLQISQQQTPLLTPIPSFELTSIPRKESILRNKIQQQSDLFLSDQVDETRMYDQSESNNRPSLTQTDKGSNTRLSGLIIPLAWKKISAMDNTPEERSRKQSTTSATKHRQKRLSDQLNNHRKQRPYEESERGGVMYSDKEIVVFGEVKRQNSSSDKMKEQMLTAMIEQKLYGLNIAQCSQSQAAINAFDKRISTIMGGIGEGLTNGVVVGGGLLGFIESFERLKEFSKYFPHNNANIVVAEANRLQDVSRARVVQRAKRSLTRKRKTHLIGGSGGQSGSPNNSIHLKRKTYKQQDDDNTPRSGRHSDDSIDLEQSQRITSNMCEQQPRNHLSTLPQQTDTPKMSMFSKNFS